MLTKLPPGPRLTRWQWIGCVLVTGLAVFTYFFALGSDHIATSVDELPYEHIARVTAASGHLLPLQSELPGMRNTKPPLLFWQGIGSTNWGRNWSLWRLRYPSVVYTLLTAGLVFWLGWKLSHRVSTGFLALLTYLAFFSTYRYGRPFLTEPPVTFWLFLPAAIFMGWRPRIFEFRWSMALLLGGVVGVGLLYKSFALLVPVTFALSWYYLRERGYQIRAFLLQDAWKIAVIGLVALAIFSLWFALDPHPEAVFKEFVFKENGGKFNSRGGGYLANLLWGGSSIWRMIVAYPFNAGFLVFPVLGVFWCAVQNRRRVNEAEKSLWIWVFTWFLVFSLPSYRTERYLLPAMPALAVLCALTWDRIARLLFVFSLIVTGGGVFVLIYLSVCLQRGMPGLTLYPAIYWLLLASAGGVVFAPWFLPRLLRWAVPVATILTYLCFAEFFRPFDGALGFYDSAARQTIRGREVWVPTSLVAKEEGYRFFLPGAEVRGYRPDPSQTVTQLSSRYPLLVIRVPMTATNLDGVKVLGQRLDLGSRHTSAQIKAMLRGRIYENLFLKEFLIEGSLPQPPR